MRRGRFWAIGVGLLVALGARAGHGAPGTASAPPSPPAVLAATSDLGLRDVRVTDEGLGRALAELRAARGARAYARVRALVQLAEVVDPAELQAALGAVASDPSLEPPTRAYAALLEAHARRRRGDLVGAARQLDALGYVSDWLVVGPFDNEGKNGFTQSFGPQSELGQPVDLERAYEGKNGPVRWRSAPDVSGVGWLDLGAMLRPQAYACAWATTFVHSAAVTRPLSLWIGTTGAFEAYWDGQLVARDDGYRQLDPDRMAVAVDLSPGTHALAFKLCGDDTPPALAVRLARPDGSPADGVQASASVAASTTAAAALRVARAAAPKGATGGPSPAPGLWPASLRGGAVAGPLQAFETELRDRPNDPAVMEEYARYLANTGGDAAASHAARDLARRAVELAPTVERALLAGRLGEDRNQRRRWIELAAGLARSDEEQVRVKLEQAALARTGPHWPDAIPLYDAVLRLAPNDVAATLGKVDLYVEAGLPRTALATLEQAVRARPRSIALLRALGGQLRSIGRDSEAADVESRYAALRFDDAGFLQHQIELAAARGDSVALRAWSARLLQADPASSWAHAVVARAHRAAGEPEAALATYRRALGVAPDDVGVLRALSDLHGELGQRDEQIRLLDQLLRIEPQSKEVRAYRDHLRPAAAPEDEKLAWPPERFLSARAEPAGDASRRILRHLTVTTLLPNGLSTTFRQVVYQPLTEEDAASARQHAFGYDADRQLVQIRAAKVYRADGRVDEAMEDGSAPADEPALRMYTLRRTYYVQFPRLEVGDVVELRYRIEDVRQVPERGEAFGEIELLQGPEPMANVEYVVSAPKERTLHLSASKLPGLERHSEERAGRRILRLFAKSVPAVRAEPRMAPWAELLGSAHVSSFASWRDVGLWYWGLVRDQFDVDDEVRARVRELVKDAADDRAKVLAVYHYVSTELRYVALELGIESIRPRRAALTLARGWGDCKDKATLIISMLRELGIRAEIVLVRTALRGRFDASIASLAPFDHAIVYVPALDLYLDGTAEQTGGEELPPADRGAMALRVNDAGAELVTLPEPPPEGSIERRSVELQPRAAGDVTFDATFENRGAFAPGWRQRYQAQDTRRERVQQDVADLLGPIELLAGPAGVRVNELSDSEKPVRVEVRGSARAVVDGAALSVPMGSGLRLAAELGSLAVRRLPLLVGAQRKLDESWTLRVPAGLRVVSAPASARVESPFGSFRLEVDQSPDRVSVRSVLVLSAGRIEPGDYARWRSFLTEADRLSGPRITLSP